MKSVKILVYGEVQGVGFRRYVWSLAKRLGLNGYVRNIEDGSVEIFAQGSSEIIDSLLSRLKQSRVFNISKIKIVELEEYTDYEDFYIL